MIINLHGFTGHGTNSKYDWLKANLPEREIFAPDLNYAATPPEEILSFLAERVSSYLATSPPDSPKLGILASSLGGFFGRCLNLLFPTVRTVLINPALTPFILLRDQLDCRAYLALFARLTFTDDDLPLELNQLRVIIGEQDELLDHERLTRPLLPPNFNHVQVIQGGVHRLQLTPEVGALLMSFLA
ncbi:MAG: hypothetical protein LBR11_01170 [Deltaproteobacteria bacterium]|jgi:predicted esterase YcpF (UPF0227 family)|nr:hypothetical protein [Deltaproteobacteria bacterium]